MRYCKRGHAGWLVGSGGGKDSDVRRGGDVVSRKFAPTTPASLCINVRAKIYAGRLIEITGLRQCSGCVGASWPMKHAYSLGMSHRCDRISLRKRARCIIYQ